MPDDPAVSARAEERQQVTVRRSAKEIENWLVRQLAELLEIAPEEVDVRKPFTYFGLGSAESVLLAADLEQWLGVSVEPTVTWDHPTIKKVARFLARSDVSISVTETSQIDRQEAREMAELLRAQLGLPPPSLPLSLGQRALWYIHQIAPTNSAYNLTYLARLQGHLDIVALQGALKLLIDRHPILRTTYTLQDGQPVQTIHPQPGTNLEVVPVMHWGKERLDKAIAQIADSPFDLESGPILRAHLFTRSKRTSLLMLTVHHIAADMWSLARLADELIALYVATASGTPPTLAPAKFDHEDYVSWQRQLLAGSEGDRQWAFWSDQLHDAPPHLDLPTDHSRPPVQTYSGATAEFNLNPLLWRKVVALARREHVTPFIVLLATFQVLLFRYTGQEDIIVGCPMLGRTRAGLSETIGYLANPVPLRANFSGEPTFHAFLHQVRDTVRDATDHQDYPLPLLVERLQPARDPSRSPLFQIAFAWEWLGKTTTPNMVAAQSLGLSVHPLEMSQRGAPFDLTLMAIQEDSQCHGVLQYNADLFEASTMARLAHHFRSLLAEIVAHSEQPVTSLSLLTSDERQALMQEWTTSAEEHLEPACIHHLFEAQSALLPDSPAVISGETSITYRELNQRSEQLAERFRALGIGTEARVGVFLDRSIDLVITLLAVLKAGGAYVPLDPATPQERLAYMLADAGVTLVLTNQRLLATLPSTGADVLCIDESAMTADTMEPVLHKRISRPEQLAYIIYTSGSTGQPKGVAIEHQSVANLIQWARRTYSPEELAGVLASTSIGFDISVFELLVPLCCGGTVVLVDNLFDLSRLPNGQVHLVNSVPSLVAEVLKQASLPSTVYTLNLAGEPCPADLVQRIYAQSRVERIRNLYGPTEATIYATAAEVPRDWSRPVPIGRPIVNTTAFVLDRQMQPVPIGVIGELYLGGAGLARGYWNRQDLTHERFVHGTFSEHKSLRLYRTGDMVRRRPDGSLVFVGRADHQVKLRGVRIELEELENILRQNRTVSQAVVVLQDREDIGKRLVAYCVLQDQLPTSDQQGISSELRAHMRRYVPEYMVPSSFVLLDRLPLTPTGKIDRRALPSVDPDSALAERYRAYVAPQTALERQLSTIWTEVLGLPQISIYDNFFDLGGVSLQALEVISRLRDLGIELAPEALLQYQTIAELASLLEQEIGS
ncbi:MAG TPA: amino acid adenylation domain-containing protein [Ktedonobacterales bacterium]|nr:amino acid adenylation domain-containing protein [Ktedonobacterales bacterium]